LMIRRLRRRPRNSWFSHAKKSEHYAVTLGAPWIYLQN
jgi:hypothetical protein